MKKLKLGNLQSLIGFCLILGINACGQGNAGSGAPIVNTPSLPGGFYSNSSALAGIWKSTKLDSFSLGITGYKTLEFAANQVKVQENCTDGQMVSLYAYVYAPIVFTSANTFQVSVVEVANQGGCSVSLSPGTMTYAISNNILTLTILELGSSIPKVETYTRIR